MDSITVDSLAQVGVRLVRGAIVDSLGACELAINEVVGRSTAEDIDFKLATSLMLATGLSGDEGGYCLGAARSGKARYAHVVTILDKLGSLFGCDNWVNHCKL